MIGRTRIGGSDQVIGEKYARSVYWALHAPPGLGGRSPDVFFERMCKPRVGWLS